MIDCLNPKYGFSSETEGAFLAFPGAAATIRIAETAPIANYGDSLVKPQTLLHPSSSEGVMLMCTWLRMRQ